MKWRIGPARCSARAISLLALSLGCFFGVADPTDSDMAAGLSSLDAASDSTERETTTFFAGVSKVDATPSVGVPLAGYGGGARRSFVPDADPRNLHTFLNPSVGVRDPIFVKALALSDGTTTVAIVTLDLIATDRDLVDLALVELSRRGVPLPADHILVCASHTHSGPGAITNRALWQLLAADLMVESVRTAFAHRIADALAFAYENLEPARFGAATTVRTGLTENRRADVSPLLDRESVDPTLGVLRIDRADGTALAVLWNFGLHGVALGPDNLQLSADIMGAVSAIVEQEIGSVALFTNAAEGDVTPIHRGQNLHAGAAQIAASVRAAWESIETTESVRIRNASETVAFGPAGLWVHPALAFPLPRGWVEEQFRFQAIRLNDVVLASVPGEPIMTLGQQIRDDGRGLGFDHLFLVTLANGHMAYITTHEEFVFGGYEALATLWGPNTGARVREACRRQLVGVR